MFLAQIGALEIFLCVNSQKKGKLGLTLGMFHFPLHFLSEIGLTPPLMVLLTVVRSENVLPQKFWVVLVVGVGPRIDL